MDYRKYYKDLLHEDVSVRTLYISPNKIDRVLVTEFFDEVKTNSGKVYYFDSLSEPSRTDEPWSLSDEELGVATVEAVYG